MQKSYCSFSAYNETGNDPTLDQAYPDPNIGGWAGELMCGTYKPTNVISLSYGGQESDLPITYQKRQCLEYMKLGLQGVSFLFASGDSGVSSQSFPLSPFPFPTLSLFQIENVKKTQRLTRNRLPLQRRRHRRPNRLSRSQPRHLQPNLARHLPLRNLRRRHKSLSRFQSNRRPPRIRSLRPSRAPL